MSFAKNKGLFPMHFYDEIGIRRVLNAAGSMTYIGGSLIHPEVLEAMRQAASAYVFIEDLLSWASTEISIQTGAEAALVTTGTTGGLVLASAACLTGMDPERMSNLPNTAGIPNQFIMQKQHRISFDHAVRVAGGTIVEVGEQHQTQLVDMESAINEHTAAILHMALDPLPTVQLSDVVTIARKYDLPIIVDAAAELPPVRNLRSFLDEGADLVIYSGGKAICGPNDSGILCGRKDLIDAARAQAYPNPGIGRSLKVSKEQIVGLVYALRRFVKINWEEEVKRWNELCEKMCEQLEDIDTSQAKVAYATSGARPLIVPRVQVTVNCQRLGKDMDQIDRELEDGESPVAVVINPGKDEIWLSPQHLHENEVEQVCQCLRTVLTPE